MIRACTPAASLYLNAIGGSSTRSRANAAPPYLPRYGGSSIARWALPTIDNSPSMRLIVLIDLVNPRVCLSAPVAAWIIAGAELDLWPSVHVLIADIPWLIHTMAAAAPPVSLVFFDDGEWRLDIVRGDIVRHVSIVPHGSPDDYQIAAVARAIRTLHRTYPELISTVKKVQT